ncbi:MAG: nitroreductase family protein [Rikenellaceae bacterium]
MIKEIEEHRSIRSFEGRAIDSQTLTEILTAASRASTCGNMQNYSLIVTQQSDMLAKISPLHFGQVERMNAPCVVTVCADVNRFSEWCRLRDAEPRYDNFIWFLNGAIDALMAAQNLILEAEAANLGACVLGTTLYTAEAIIDLLELPNGVIPVTSVVLGYPAENPPLTDRLPLEAVVHFEKYENYTAPKVEALWAEREASAETASLLEENELPNLAQIFTLKRYTAQDNVTFSKSYFSLLKKQGFFNHE